MRAATQSPTAGMDAASGGPIPQGAGRLGGDLAGFGVETIKIAMGNGHTRQREAALTIGFKGAAHTRAGAERFEIHCSLLETHFGLRG